MASNRTLCTGIDIRAALHGTTWAWEIAVDHSFSSCGVGALVGAVGAGELIVVEEEAIN